MRAELLRAETDSKEGPMWRSSEWKLTDCKRDYSVVNQSAHL